MYNFISDLPINEFNDFVGKVSCAPIQQTEGWSKVKNNWTPYFCGIEKDGILVGAALILIRRLMPGLRYAYCPRGPVMDLTDPKAVLTFTEGALEFCKKRGVYLLTADPPVVVGKRLPDLEKERYCDSFDTERGRKEFENLMAAGFRHKGFGKRLDSATQPRYNAMIPLKDRQGKPLADGDLKKHYRKKLRKYLGSFQTNRGLYYEDAKPTKENVALFKKILSHTEERQKIALRSEGYFSLLAKAFGDDAAFAFEKCNVDRVLSYLETRIEEEPELRETLETMKEEAIQVKAKRGKEVPLAALLTVYPPNREGVRIAEYLYAGADLTVFPSFCATVCGLFAQIGICRDMGCDFLNLGGVSGTFDDGLYRFKSPFNPIIVEYAGEFDLPVCKWKYALMEKGFPLMKKCYSGVRKKLKQK